MMILERYFKTKEDILYFLQKCINHYLIYPTRTFNSFMEYKYKGEYIVFTPIDNEPRHPKDYYQTRMFESIKIPIKLFDEHLLLGKPITISDIEVVGTYDPYSPISTWIRRGYYREVGWLIRQIGKVDDIRRFHIIKKIYESKLRKLNKPNLHLRFMLFDSERLYQIGIEKIVRKRREHNTLPF